MTDQQTVWIARSLHRKFKTLAARTGQKLNEVIEEALESFLAGKGKS